LAASDFSSAFVKIAINVAMNNTRNDESPGQHHQCSVWFGKPQGTRHWTMDARSPGSQNPILLSKIAGQCSVLCADIYGGHCAAK